MLHVPILRHGAVYRSLDTAPVPDVTGEARAEVSLANAALIRRDLRKLDAARAALRAIPVAELVARTVAAAEIYLTADLPVGDDLQGPDDYVRACSASTGLPQSLVRANMDKIANVCRELPTILNGLTLGMDLSVLDSGVGEVGGIPVSFVPAARSLTAVLPSNSPGVHSLWIPALALKTPVVLKPGSGDPFTPLRIVQALIAAGIPSEAFGFYPADRATGAELVEIHDRALVFGGPAMAAKYAGRPEVQVHGPGYAKILLGPDTVDHWADHLDLLVDSVARNGGRSCINASTIVVPRHGHAIAEALAERLGAVAAKALDDADAGLAAFAEPASAAALDAAITERGEGAEVLGASPRRVQVDGLDYLRPTVVVADKDHPLAKTEFPFPFVSVVEVPPDEAVAWMGDTLVCSAITEDPDLRRALLDAPTIDRLHLGAVPTTAIRWDQPHEGNLFQWLWRRRAVAVG